MDPKPSFQVHFESRKLKNPLSTQTQILPHCIYNTFFDDHFQQKNNFAKFKPYKSQGKYLAFELNDMGDPTVRVFRVETQQCDSYEGSLSAITTETLLLDDPKARVDLRTNTYIASSDPRPLYTEEDFETYFCTPDGQTVLRLSYHESEITFLNSEMEELDRPPIKVLPGLCDVEFAPSDLSYFALTDRLALFIVKGESCKEIDLFSGSAFFEFDFFEPWLYQMGPGIILASNVLKEAEPPIQYEFSGRPGSQFIHLHPSRKYFFICDWDKATIDWYYAEPYRNQKLVLLLLCRSKISESVFGSQSLPLDIFKDILRLSNLV